MNFSSATLEDALRMLGAVLKERGLEYSVVAVGGGNLLLLGLIDRTTKDLDVVAIKGSDGFLKADPLPEELLQAIEDTGLALALAPDWLNAGPAGLMDFGLPQGFEGRLETRRFDSLELGLLGRLDQIALKLYAAIDQGPQSKHATDLSSLEPTPDELLEAARWTRRHDPSEGFKHVLLQALEHFGIKIDDI